MTALFSSMSKKVDAGVLCGGCVYYPPNLPQQFYSPDDWVQLQQLSCAHDCSPGSEACQQTRKTHCDLLDLRAELDEKSR